MGELTHVARRHRNAAKAHHKATDPELYVSVPRAARILNVTRNTVYNWLAQGTLKSERIAGRLVVVKASLSAGLPSPVVPK